VLYTTLIAQASYSIINNLIMIVSSDMIVKLIRLFNTQHHLCCDTVVLQISRVFLDKIRLNIFHETSHQIFSIFFPQNVNQINQFNPLQSTSRVSTPFNILNRDLNRSFNHRAAQFLHPLQRQTHNNEVYLREKKLNFAKKSHQLLKLKQKFQRENKKRLLLLQKNHQNELKKLYNYINNMDNVPKYAAPLIEPGRTPDMLLKQQKILQIRKNPSNLIQPLVQENLNVTHKMLAITPVTEKYQTINDFMAHDNILELIKQIERVLRVNLEMAEDDEYIFRIAFSRFFG